jgi:putative intracellular protease/amidase
MDDRGGSSQVGSVHILLLGYDGVDDLDFFGAWSVLSKAAQMTSTAADGPALTAQILSIESRFRTAAGITISPPARADCSSPAAAIVIPGGAGAADAGRCPELRSRLIAERAGGARFYTICSGALLPAACGLLEGMRVAIHGAKIGLLKDSGCREIVSGCQRDDWLTSIGGAPSEMVKSVRIGFQVLEDFCPSVVEAVSSRMEISRKENVRDACILV